MSDKHEVAELQKMLGQKEQRIMQLGKELGLAIEGLQKIKEDSTLGPLEIRSHFWATHFLERLSETTGCRW